MNHQRRTIISIAAVAALVLVVAVSLVTVNA
jgi:hypothetical protein